MTTLPAPIPVLIVGTGSAGLTPANLLGTEGVEVLVVERNKTICDLPCRRTIELSCGRTVKRYGPLSLACCASGYRGAVVARTCGQNPEARL